ncbi:MAG: sigma-54 dependent transcriptional regulator [Desulfuromonadaceae bacterium]|nr:sigma-54 dependent transcriptional regulator [Desulfuromonadaceae bacterium]MDD2849264.1 sigma-54 dependent transcriptional regulator [Desulfuromonadaceae bacterium]MDD4131891.1 sigma-54 dependent transcriptional regulator [Desulfuromonadaceae bacterium]
MNNQDYSANPIMLVDDETEALSLLKSFLCHDGFQNVITFDDSLQALDSFRKMDIALAVIDLRMPKLHGTDLLEAFSKLKPSVPVIVVTAESHVDIAIDCMKTGAVDYLTKPITINRFITSVKRALELRRLHEEISLLENSFDGDISTRAPQIPSIITRDREMLTLLSYVEVVSKSRQPVLITGETGVGKELVARAVHTLSGLKGGFTSINIAGLDDQMFSDTLFGHRRGAFTGALNDRDGLIMKAAKGTIFLDEIGDLNELSQIKLLRLLQENEYYQLGSDIPLRSDVRLVVATNKNLWQCMNEGKFRKDLYYRLCTHHVAIPPLRKRPDDIPLLLEHFIRQSAKALGKGKLTYRKELVDFIVTYEFPGNIRELQSIVHDFVSRTTTSKLSTTLLKKIIAREQEPANLLMGQGSTATDPDFNGVTFSSFPTLKQAESILIEKALEIAKNNQGTAARLLGITRQALNNRLRRDKGQQHT